MYLLAPFQPLLCIFPIFFKDFKSMTQVCERFTNFGVAFSAVPTTDEALSIHLDERFIVQ